MYRKHPDGTSMDLQGVTAHLPPPGVVYDRMSGEWVRVDIKKRSNKKSEQFWERDELPAWYGKKRKEEERLILESGDPDFYIEELEEVRREHWFYRINGRWFMNNGEPVYITGEHWMYLNWHPIDVGYPSYFNYDRMEFYHRQVCMDDPRCYGQLIVGPRRCGKTYKAGNFILEGTSRHKNSNGGIQSKTGPDAKKVFGKAVVSQFKKLPHFFKPVYDTSGGTTPKSEIRFFHTSRKGKATIEDMGEELESIIDFRSSDKYAYDGEKMLRILHDEIFKTKECDVYERYDVVKECLVDNTSGTIVGTYLGTSTVEDVEGHTETYERMWKDSDPSERDGNGHTRSGLYRFFINAAHTRNMDRYGNCDIEKNMKTILNTLEGMRDDQKKYSDYKRKYPLDIRDAFRPQARDCHYDIEKLSERYDLLAVTDPRWENGELRWNVPGDMSEGVRWVPKKNGPFRKHVSIDLNGEGPWNNVEWNGSKPNPRNKAKYTIGIDPFDHKTTVDGRRSDGAGSAFRKYDPMDPLNSDRFVLLYRFRPKKPSIFYDDMLKMCWVLGCQMLFEDQKQGIRQHFDAVNCDRFMLQLPDRKEPGIPAHDRTHQAIVDHTSEYIEDCIDLIDDMDLIKDWMQFDINNTTKFDEAMSTGYALLAANRIRPARPEKEEEMTDITDIFPVYS